MASNFAFAPMGLTVQMTVSASATSATFWLGTSLTSGLMAPSGIRMANVGSVIAFITFGAPGQPLTVGVGTSMPSFPNTVETFMLKGQNSLAFITSANTTTLYITPGEGL